MGELPTEIGPIGLVNPTARVEPCACGGEIVATHLDDLSLRSAVAIHRTTFEHRTWIELEDLALVLPADVVPLDRELARELYGGSRYWRGHPITESELRYMWGDR